MLRFSSPKLIAPLESVIEPSPSVKLPIFEAVANVATPAPNVPVVLRFSSPKLIAPLESVIEPSPSVKLPIFEPVAAVTIPLATTVPDIFKSSTNPITPSLESPLLALNISVDSTFIVRDVLLLELSSILLAFKDIIESDALVPAITIPPIAATVLGAAPTCAPII